MVAGCADSHFASSNASASMQPSSDTDRTQREPPVQVGYGMTSDGPTTDVYTEIFGSSKARENAAVTASPPAVAQGRPAAGSSAAVPQGQPAMASNAAPPMPAAPPAEQATPSAYGISSNG